MVKKCIVASCVLIKNGKALLLKHKKLGVWLYPGGHIDENEVPIEAAVREAKEETGYTVSIIGTKPLGFSEKGVAREMPMPMCTMYETVPYKSGTHMHFDNIYVGKPTGKRSRISQDESSQLRWFSQREISKIDTYENVKAILRLAFKYVKTNN